ncbi:MAG TPA: Gldg family protein, partial [Polyangiaceae bacterium]
MSDARNERPRKHWFRGRFDATSPSTGIAASFGLLATFGIVVLLNLFAARYDRRWDFTPDRRYTPPMALRRLLESVTEPTTATVLLSRDDPMAPTVDQLLSSYRLVNRRLSIDWVDPDRDPARFLARQSELGLHAGRTEDGQVRSDAVIVVSSRQRHYFIEASDIVGLDPEALEGTGAFEQAFGKALRVLFERQLPTVCFTEGARELSITDRSPVGLSALKERLERESIKVRSVDSSQSAADGFDACRLVVVAAPDVSLTPEALRRITAASKRSSLLVLGGVVPDDTGRLQLLGLEALAQLGG